MQKTFYIKSRDFKEISEGRGSLEYLLLDEKGDERIVTATAQLNRSQTVSKIKPVYQREIPLVRALAKAAVGDRVRVDFIRFNAKNPRSKMGSKKFKSGTNQSYGSFSELHYLLSDKVRILQLCLMGGVGFIGVLLLQGSI